MQKLLTFIKTPYQQKGFFWGTIDSLLKLIVLFVWVYLTVVLVQLFAISLATDYNPVNKLWWFSYCFLMFFGLTWLSYIVLFVRDYNEE